MRGERDERERKEGVMRACVRVFARTCVCVRERERERKEGEGREDREGKEGGKKEGGKRSTLKRFN